MRMIALGWLGLCLVIGCGGDDGAPPDDEVPTTKGDSGTNSDEGIDCDDEVPEITDECRRCAQANEGCPCPSGTRPMQCDPDDIQTEMNGVKGVLVCTEGARYCRDGAWSACEIIWMYTTFVPTK